MAKRKKAIKDDLDQANVKFTSPIPLNGSSGMTYAQYNNATRSTMFTSHLKQFRVLNKSEFPGLFMNTENLAGKYSSSYKRVKNDSVIIKKIQKFQNISDKGYYYLIFVLDKKEKKYKVIERKECENLTEIFGFKYNNEVIDDYIEGDTIAADTVVLKSTSYDETMNYGFGLNIPMMYTSDPYTAEDAAIISKSLQKTLESTDPYTISIGINQNDVLLNLYGDKNNYKVFPDIGERCYGELVTKRTLFNNQLLMDFKDNTLNKILPSDISYFGEGEVIDITIYCNNEELEDNIFNSQIIKYLEAQDDYYQEIYDTCEDIIKSGYAYSKDIEYLFKRAKDFLDKKTKWKKDSVFSNLLVDITIRNVKGAEKGQKVTGRYGNKSVISDIRDDDDMPYYYDDNGNKVIIHLLLNELAIINRTASSPLIETDINFFSRKIRHKMQTMKKLEDREALLFKYIGMLNEEQAKSMKAVYDRLSREEKEEYMNDIINDRIYIRQKPMGDLEPIFYKILEVQKEFDFMEPDDIYINKWGRQIKCLNPIRVGEMYIMKLKQTSEKGFSARNNGSIDSKGLPERNYKNKSFTEKEPSTPIRFGESEYGNFFIGAESDDIQLFTMMYRTSPAARRHLVESMLLGEDNVTAPKEFKSRIGEVFTVLFKSLGLGTKFKPLGKEELREYDDSTVKLFELDGNEYLCTEFDFLLIKRRKEIEKEILREHGVIDYDDLNDKTMEILKDKKYIIDILKSEYDTKIALNPDMDTVK